MIRFYYHPSPNPAKVALLLEELETNYTMVPVDTRKGEQLSAEYLRINPNGKTPAIVDEDSGATVFDSTAILLYLAEKTGRFLSDATLSARGQMLSWLMFTATGIGPYSGQAVHFRHFAPEKLPYAINRYDYEARRHWGLLDAHLENRRYMMGGDYTIVDMAVWGWAGPVPFVMDDDNAWSHFPNVRRLFDEINARPAAQRAVALKQRHAFKSEVDDDARYHLFPQNRKR